MNKMLWILSLLLICVILCSCVLGTVSHCAPIGMNGKATIEQPYYFNKYSVRWGEITNHIVCGNVLYILYEGKETLDCYSIDGTYLHSYALVLGEKGTAELFAVNDVLHLKNRERRFYTFNAGFFMDSYEIPTTELYAHIELLTNMQQQTKDNEFEMRGASLWRYTDGISNEIVRRPGWMTIFQGSALLIVGPICFILLCAILYYYKKQT